MKEDISRENLVSVRVDTPEMYQWAREHFDVGTWGQKIGWVNKSATYCFQYKNDALLFTLVWGGK